jgi:hypothetical protein
MRRTNINVLRLDCCIGKFIIEACAQSACAFTHRKCSGCLHGYGGVFEPVNHHQYTASPDQRQIMAYVYSKEEQQRLYVLRPRNHTRGCTVVHISGLCILTVSGMCSFRTKRTSICEREARVVINAYCITTITRMFACVRRRPEYPLFAGSHQHRVTEQGLPEQAYSSHDCKPDAGMIRIGRRMPRHHRVQRPTLYYPSHFTQHGRLHGLITHKHAV